MLQPPLQCTSKSIVCFVVLCFLLCQNSSCGIIDSEVEVDQTTPQSAGAVTIELYYESLCPGCRNFITTSLYHAWKTLRQTGIMDIKMYPYGNAHEEKLPNGHYAYHCQHGDKECRGNFIEACIQRETNFNADVYFPVLECMETAKEPLTVAKQCLELYVPNAKWSLVSKCAHGSDGEKLMHEYAVKTGSLNPPHKYVPWIVINGEHTEELEQEAFDDLVGLVCKLYSGKKPDECQQDLVKLSLII